MNKKFYKTREDIENWLNKYQIKNYNLISDEQYGFVVDVNGSVFLANKDLNLIPVKFNNINGSFYCNGNKLKSLEFCPNSVGESFNGYGNKKLGNLQYINDFSKIYQANKDLVKQIEYEELNSVIQESSSIKKNKI